MRFSGWISGKIVSLKPDTDIRNAFLDISRILSLGKVAHCTIIHLVSAGVSFQPSVP